MSVVMVFKTSVSSPGGIERVRPMLDELIPEKGSWNFDLEDCDCILRVESRFADARKIEEELKKAGFNCAELRD